MICLSLQGRSFHAILLGLLIGAGPAAFASDPVVISGASPTDGISITSSSGTVTYPLSIENTTNADIKGVKIEISNLVGPNSHIWDARLSNPDASLPPSQSLTVDIPKLQRINLTLTAKAPEAGLYQSSLALIYGDKRYPIPVKVNRVMVVPSVKVLGLDSVAFAGCDTRSVRFTIKETNGINVTLNPPTLTSLSQKDGDKSLQAHFNSMRMVYVAADGSEQTIDRPFQVAGKRAYPVRMEISGLDDPGQYIASLDIGTDDGSLDAQTVTIFVKRSVFIAAILIAFGVLISMAIRKYTTEGRPRLLLRRKLLFLETDLEVLGSRMPDPVDQDILTFLKRRLQRAEADIELGQTTGVDAIVSDVNQKLTLLPDLSGLRKKVDGMPPLVDTADGRKTVSDIESLMYSRDNSAQEPLSKVTENIREASKKLDDAVQKYIESQIAAAQTELGHFDSSLTPGHRDQFALEVKDKLTAASDEAKKRPPVSENAAALVDQARRAAARIFVDDLNEKLIGPKEMPDAVWIPLQRRFASAASMARAATSGDEAMKAYKEADSAWLDAMFHALSNQATVITDQASKTNSDGHQALVEGMKQQRQDIVRGQAALLGGDLSGAHDIYAAVKKAIDDAHAALEPVASMMKKMGSTPTTTFTNKLSKFFDSPGLLSIAGLETPSTVDAIKGRSPLTLVSVDDIERKIKIRDRWISGITAIVAVLLGVFLLWLDNLTWGSWKDMLAAVLWGLGVHQIAGNAPFAKLDLGTLDGQLSGTSGRSGSDGRG